jgi:hypothetical protein
MATKKGYNKRFKIGEYAIGGIIQVDIHGKIILISALDWFTKEIVTSGSHLTNIINSRFAIHDFLNELTSSYYADKILTWIESKVKLGNEFDIDTLL